MNYDGVRDAVEGMGRVYGGIDLASTEMAQHLAVLMRYFSVRLEESNTVGKLADEQNGVWVLVKDEDVLPPVLVAARPVEPESYFRCPRRRDED